jgi:ADP-ribose pyrophosphatase
MPYRTLSSNKQYQGKVFNVRTDQVESPEGKLMSLDVVEHQGAVAMIPIDPQGRIILVEQYRHPAGTMLLELPAGTLEPEEDPSETAARECREEIGLAPGKLERLGGVFLAPGYSTEYLHFFLASELTPAPLAPDEDEDLKPHSMTIDEVLAAIDEGRIQDGKTLAGILLWQRHRQREAKP